MPFAITFDFLSKDHDHHNRNRRRKNTNSSDSVLTITTLFMTMPMIPIIDSYQVLTLGTTAFAVTTLV